MQIARDQRPPGSGIVPGVIVNDELAKNMGGKLGDRIVLQGTIYAVDLELYVRGIFSSYPDNKSVYFNAKYVEEAVSWFKGRSGHL